MKCTCRKYKVVLKGIPSKEVELFSTYSSKGVLRKVALLRLETHPLLFIRTVRGQSYTTQPYKTWRRYHDDGDRK